ncbi:SCO family protein [Candidatus Thiodiazotropha sp. CDECU1]|uniref:SCO family protein n=1 Tax=Candidatus Thiodiazotropha sp. CDECU1 TaxID=3065865 RepID=UPI00292FF2F6|nr:SCO family protein [Candidatus Thiodiazotropha sp. CDECU1]
MMSKKAWRSETLNNSLRFMLKTLVFSCVLSTSLNGVAEELPSIAKSENDKPSFIPPFKMDCVTKPTKSPTLGERFKLVANMDDHSHHDHAKHMKMMESRNYKLNSASYSVPDVELTSHRGEQKRLSDVLNSDKPIMLNFIFTTCTTICPVLSASFHQVQEILGEESDRVDMVSITIDPDYDTPEQLMKYSKRFKAGDQWQFFTGSYQDVVMVEKAFDIFRGSKMNHEPITLIRDRNGEQWTRINGLASAEDIVKEYRKITAGSQ